MYTQNEKKRKVIFSSSPAPPGSGSHDPGQVKYAQGCFWQFTLWSLPIYTLPQKKCYFQFCVSFDFECMSRYKAFCFSDCYHRRNYLKMCVTIGLNGITKVPNNLRSFFILYPVVIALLHNFREHKISNFSALNRSILAWLVFIMG